MFWVEVLPVEGGHDPVFMQMVSPESINGGQVNRGDDGMCSFSPYKDPSGSPANVPAWTGLSSLYPPGSNSGDGRLYFRHSCDGQPIAFAGDDGRAFFASGNWVSGFDAKTAAGPNGESMLPLFDAKLPGIVRAPAAPLVDSLNQVVVAGWEGSETVRTNYWTPVFTETGKGTVAAIDPTSGAAYWSFTTDTRLDGSPVEYQGTIVVIDRAGRVYGLDQITGGLKWSWKPEGYEPPAVDDQGPAGQTLALSGRYLYVPHPDGHVYTLDARDGSVLSSAMFPARPYDLAIDDTNNAIYVRTLDGYVGAYRTLNLPKQCAADPDNPPPPARGQLARVSLEADGSELSGFGAADERPAISADGRVVAYKREGPDSTSEIRIRDLATHATTIIPATQTSGEVTRINPRLPSLSTDGRYIAYIARERSPQGLNDLLLVLDRETGVSEPVLKKPDGSTEYRISLDGASPYASRQWESAGYSMSGDARMFAFVSSTNNIVPGDTDKAADVFVVDRVTGERKLASHRQVESPYNEYNESPSISRDGRFVAFTSDQSITGAPVASGANDGVHPFVHLYDVDADTLTALTNPETGMVINGRSPRVSGDGRFVAFTSMAPSLYPPAMRETDPWWSGRSIDVFVWDRATGKIDFASPNDSGEHARYASIERPAISDDGQYLAFQSTGLFVKWATFEQAPQIIERDRAAGTTRQISHTQWGVSGTGDSLAPAVSADGQRVVFLSSAPDLVDNDTNNVRDVFLYDRSRTSVEPADPPEPDLAECPAAGGEQEAYSDLAVQPEDIKPGELEQGQPGEIAVTVHNAGGVASEAASVRLYDGSPEHGTLLGEQPLPELAAGGTKGLTFSWDPVGESGAHTLTASVDPDRLVFEQDVADNEAGLAVSVAAPRLDLSVGADRQTYRANETVSLTAHIANHSVVERGMRLVASIRDADGDEVAKVYDGQVEVGPNGTALVPATWRTLDTTPGRYTVSTRLLNALGDELTAATSWFEIQPDVEATVALATDQVSYRPSDTAQVSALVTNRSVNSSLTGAYVELTLAAADGTVLDHWQLEAGDVMQGKSAKVSQSRSLRGLDAGSYRLSGKLLGATGDELGSATADFAVSSSAETGDGVSGSLTASPSDPYRLSTATFKYSVTDGGNADIPGAKVRVRISDIDSGQVLKSLDDEREIRRGDPNTGSLSTRIDMAEDRDYQVSLHLVLSDGTERPLDRTIIHVRPVPFSYGATFDPAPGNRVLVWACDRDDEAVARAALADTFATYIPDRADSRYQRENGCGLFRHDELKRFARLMRSGDYNQFWLLGRHHPLHGGTGDELAARVIQGDGLLVAGGYPGFDLEWWGNRSPLGASFSGTLPSGTHTLQFAPTSPFSGLDADVTWGARVTTTEATGIATTAWGPAANRRISVTATYNQFGKGKAIYLGTAPNAFVNRARARAVLSKAADALLPAPEAAHTGGMARLQLWVQGEAPGTPVEMHTQLPAGVTVPQLPTDVSLTGDLLSTPFDAGGTERKQRDVWVKLPAAGSSVTTHSTAYFRNPADGTMKPYGDAATATVGIPEDKPAAGETALAALAQVGTSSLIDRWRLDAIKQHVHDAAQDSSSVLLLHIRLRALVDDIGTLERARWSNTEPARTAIARLVTYVEYDYHRAGGDG